MNQSPEKLDSFCLFERREDFKFTEFNDNENRTYHNQRETKK